jgi:cytochrome P450
MAVLVGRSGPPLVGESIDLFRDPYAFGARHFERYGPVFKSHLLGKPAIVLLSAEGQKFVLVTAQKSLDTGAGYAIIKGLLGDALTLTDAEVHERLKRLMTPAFAARNMEAYLEIINRVIAQRLATWQTSGTVRLMREFATLTFTFGTALLLGLDFGDETHEMLAHWNTFAKGVTTLIHFVPGPVTKYGRALGARAWLDAKIRTIIARQRASDRPNVIRMLADAGMSDDEIATQVIFLIHASFDTTTDTLAWAFAEMLRHPEVLQRVKAEVRADDRDAPIVLADLQQKPLLDALIQESLRLYPQVHIFFRGAKEDLEFDGYPIKKGWLVNLIPAFTHRRADYFPNPDTFDPDRFLPPRDKEIPPYAWIGFGGGMHGCLGEMIARLEIKALATALLRSYDLDLVPHQDLRQIYASLSRPRSGVLVRYQRRES